MAKIYLQRHTRPLVAPNICYGVSDIPLHEEFMTLHLGEVLGRLEGIKVANIYSSPLQRCLSLANIIAEHQEIAEVIIERRAMELNFGDWEMISWDDIFESPEGKAWFNDYINYPTPHGEAFSDLVARAQEVWHEFKNANEDILIVTHSGFMRAMMIVAGVVSPTDAFSAKIEYGELVVL
ncbi:MAG: histidine phosphatase family protein [Rikenellaceae bacterium]